MNYDIIKMNEQTAIFAKPFLGRQFKMTFERILKSFLRTGYKSFIHLWFIHL